MKCIFVRKECFFEDEIMHLKSLLVLVYAAMFGFYFYQYDVQERTCSTAVKDVMLVYAITTI
jgi:hypothetical protein